MKSSVALMSSSLASLVDAPVVLSAGAQALVGFIADANVDGQHGQIVIGEGLAVAPTRLVYSREPFW